jgi:hypothetical protein
VNVLAGRRISPQRAARQGQRRHRPIAPAATRTGWRRRIRSYPSGRREHRRYGRWLVAIAARGGPIAAVPRARVFNFVVLFGGRPRTSFAAL